MGRQCELEDLFWRIIKGSDARLRLIARRYASSVDSQDLYQEILLQLWRSVGKYEGKSQPDTWAYRVALNTAQTFRRRLLRHTDKSEVGEPLEEYYKQEPNRPVSRTGVVRSQSKLLEEFANSLSQFDQALLLMYLNKLTYQEISEITGLSRLHIAVKVHRIKRAFLKEYIET